MPGETWGGKFKKYLGLITVEPTMVLYMMAFMLTSVVEQSFYVYKACKVNHGFNDTICKNITAEKYEDYNKEVQVVIFSFICNLVIIANKYVFKFCLFFMLSLFPI